MNRYQKTETASSMRHFRSVRVQLSLLFSFFFVLTGALGLFSILELSSFNHRSADVADVWLPTTRAIGDLNNYTSDFHAAENGIFVPLGKSSQQAIERDFEALDRSIAQAERDFEAIPHPAPQQLFYATFKARWNEYRSIVNKIVALVRDGRSEDAILLQRGASREAYGAADTVLTKLTDLVVDDGKLASEQLNAAYRKTFWLIGLAILLAALLVCVAFFYITRAISRPLLLIAGRFRLLAANRTDIDIPGSERSDEIGEMARAALVFRDNAIELARSRAELAHQAKALKHELEQEQQLAVRQRNFISMASHEFRTPLTVIDGHARRLIKGVVPREEVSERAGKIRQAALRLTHLIENLLEAARLADSIPAINPVEFELTKLLRDVCQLHRDGTPLLQIVERYPESVKFIGDPQLLFQAFGNLLSNAVKYSGAAEPIEVTAVTDDRGIAVSIVDHGIGIPSADMDRLFERYYRGGNVSGTVGTGVGLYVVKMIIELHGGTVSVDSEEGRGATFAVMLPL